MLIKNEQKARHDAADIIEFSNVEDDHEHGYSTNFNKIQLHLDDKPQK
jgi:hypothetical protein